MYGGVETLAQHIQLRNRQGYIAMQFFFILFWLMEDSGAGGRTYWVWSIGEGWVFTSLWLQCDKVSCTYGRRRECLDQTQRCRFISDSLQAYRLNFPPAKYCELHYIL